MIRWKSRFKNGQLYHPLSWLEPQENRFNLLTQGKIWSWTVENFSPGGSGWTSEQWVEILPGGAVRVSYLWHKPH